MAGGRPTIYTPELVDLICQRVATHTCGLTPLCEMYEDMPHRDTVNEWRYRYPEFSDKYAEAKRFQAELMAEEINEIASQKHYYIDAEGNKRVDSGFIASQRLIVDSIKWQASKLAPKIYGDKTHNTVVTVSHEDALKYLE